MRGGEQPETDGRSQIQVNSIRQSEWASLRGQGEACGVSRESIVVRVLPILPMGQSGCGWSENDQKEAWGK